jgi:Ca2+-binding EF-hand superfamily protein
MVSHLSTKKEQAELRKTFNQFDSNGDGKIEEEEFVNAYKKVYPHMDPETVAKEATQFFKAADVDKNGSIDFGEWCAATIDKRGLLNE